MLKAIRGSIELKILNIWSRKDLWWHTTRQYEMPWGSEHWLMVWNKHLSPWPYAPSIDMDGSVSWLVAMYDRKTKINMKKNHTEEVFFTFTEKVLLFLNCSLIEKTNKHRWGREFLFSKGLIRNLHSKKDTIIKKTKKQQRYKIQGIHTCR